MPRYCVTAEFIIEADNHDQAENIVDNAVSATAEHVYTYQIIAEPDLEDLEADDVPSTLE